MAAVMLVAACGDPTSVGSDVDDAVGQTDPTAVVPPPESTSAVLPTDVRLCSDPPFGGSKQPSDDVVQVVNQFVNAHPDLFAGMWWDGAVGEYVFAAVDVDQSSPLIAQELPSDLIHRVERVARSASELAVLQQHAATLTELGIEASSGQRVWDAVLEIDLPILDEPSLDAVRQVFGDDLDAVCVTGADPATVPPDGPQPTSGVGWRLLADQTQRGEAYSVNVAVTTEEYESLWASLALDGDRPAVDFATEIVIQFGAVYSGSCPEIRLDGVNFDHDRSLVTAAVVQLGGNRSCTADANSRAYVVAVETSRLPALPFVVSLQPDCSYCDHREISTLDGTQSPVAALTEFDRTEILAAAAIARLKTGVPVFDTIDVVEVVGHATLDAPINFERGVALTEAERNTIIQSLSPRTVQFIPLPTSEQLVAAEGYAVLSLAEPVVVDGRLTITTALWCGNLCGTGGASAVERLDNATWAVTDPVGPQWMA
jgi:hypothetical protein